MFSYLISMGYINFGQGLWNRIPNKCRFESILIFLEPDHKIEGGHFPLFWRSWRICGEGP